MSIQQLFIASGITRDVMRHDCITQHALWVACRCIRHALGIDYIMKYAFIFFTARICEFIPLMHECERANVF